MMDSIKMVPVDLSKRITDLHKTSQIFDKIFLYFFLCLFCGTQMLLFEASDKGQAKDLEVVCLPASRCTVTWTNPQL